MLKTNYFAVCFIMVIAGAAALPEYYGCVHNGVDYEVRTVFPDDCNTCSCQTNGLVKCTKKSCGDKCKNGKRPLPGEICGGIAALKCPNAYICEDSSAPKGGADLSGLCCPDCQAVRCGTPSCKNPSTPPGQCCPVCPDCSTTICTAIKCPYDIWTTGACCPICGQVCSYKGVQYDVGTIFYDDCNQCSCNKNGRVSCTKKKCGEKCKNGKRPLPGKKCSTKKGSKCPDGFICETSTAPKKGKKLSGRCCPDCSNVRCAIPPCPNPFTPQDCTNVRCAEPKCKNAYLPKGKCCKICQE